MPKWGGGHNRFLEAVKINNMGHSNLAILKGVGRTFKVLSCLEGRVQQVSDPRFPIYFRPPPLLPVTYDQSLRETEGPT